ncbi:hypothetical protein CTI12_AA195460 [Artemisia annua]|uniref:Translation initiation factor 3 n=1 Tax=Artemisia annua TaxID=35608 RepID=A0A2U1P467_ARTAN|nr:hypothetical protein CTI12_AA195460 [Artemisia annua]
MVLFWCRTKQAQLRALSSQLTRCYFQMHGSSPVIRETRVGVVNTPSLGYNRTGSEVGNFVRFFAAPVQVKSKYEDKDKDKGQPKMNEEISAQYVRLVTDEGHEVVSRHEALERARRLSVDLVEVQPDGKPPVCKLMDYKKEMYLRQVKEKELAKQKANMVLRNSVKEVKITMKIDKHDLQTKADAVKRLAEKGYRIKCMAVAIPGVDPKEQKLAELLTRFFALIDDFSIVESGPSLEFKQAFAIVRHVKFGPLKKGPKKMVIETSNDDTETQSTDDLPKSETNEGSISEEAIEVDDVDLSKFKRRDNKINFALETSNVDRAGSVNRYASANGSENRYATKRQPNPQSDLNRRGPAGERALGYGMFGASKPNSDPQRESGPPQATNRYKQGPSPQRPPSDYRGPRGDFNRENTDMNPRGARAGLGGSRR